MRIANSCEPNFALCRDIPIKESSRYISCPVKAKFRYYNSRMKSSPGKAYFQHQEFKVGNIRQEYDGDFILPEGYWFLHTNWHYSGSGNGGHARIYKNGQMICNS